MKEITMRGVRTHNLKNLDVTIPRDKLIVLTGLSGSGKSSLAFDTLYAEGQRRYVESLSSYARQFLSMMEKPDVDSIEGLSPAISIEQKSTSHNPRSTVGTITEIYDYLRLLFAKVGEPRCPKHGTLLKAQTVTEMVDNVLKTFAGTKIMILAPLIRERKGEHNLLLQNLRAQGFIRARIDKVLVELDELPELDANKKHTIEVVVDRIKVKEDSRLRLAESFETALQLTSGLAAVVKLDDKNSEPLVFSSQFACHECGYSMPALEPRLFSFNNPMGACSACDGLGFQQIFDVDKVVHNPGLSLAGGAIHSWDRNHFYYHQMLVSLANHYKFNIEKPFRDLPKKIQDIVLYGSGDEIIRFTYTSDRGRSFSRMTPFEGVINNMKRRYRETDADAVREGLAKYLIAQSCSECGGSRLSLAARHVFVTGTSITDIVSWPLDKTKEFFASLKLTGAKAKIAVPIVKEIQNRIGFLINVGLDYLNIARRADTLSGGEAQRIRLASQIGSGLVGVMYILDEPSIGLHQRDNKRLLETLMHLRDLGNTVIVVEHDKEAICSADWVIDLGPGAGVHGGHIVAKGAPQDIMACSKSLTGEYLTNKKSIKIPDTRIAVNSDKALKLKGARGNNLKKVDVTIPLGLMVCVTGVSGSGKSTLVNDTLYPIITRSLYGSNRNTPLDYDDIAGLEHLDKVVDIDQSPIGRTPRSNPATYTGLFTPIRELFAATREARSRGYKPGRFSFNVKGGRCEACQGDGVIKVEMHFLSNIYVTCDACKGKRYNRETLEIQYKGKNIYEILELTVEDALEFFAAIPVLKRKLETLVDVGLSYIKLGQSAITLSGGEAQRIKLAKELSKRDTGNTLYILDEPTTGLHFHDVKQLLNVLHRLRDHGNSILIIEHNLDVIKTADWIIDLGPEGGDKGGMVIATGTPEDICRVKKSYTGKFLKLELKNS